MAKPLALRMERDTGALVALAAREESLALRMERDTGALVALAAREEPLERKATAIMTDKQAKTIVFMIHLLIPDSATVFKVCYGRPKPSGYPSRI